MKIWPVVVALVVLATACGGMSEDEEEPIDTAGVRAAAANYALSHGVERGQGPMYVVGPSVELWEMYCGAGFAAEIEAACAVLDSIAFDLPETFRDAAAREISEALAPSAVEFVASRDDALDFEERPAVGSIKNDGGLLSFGVAIEWDGRIYVPVEGHAVGWLFEAAPSTNGWQIEAIASWIA